jgi:hypothetical protein
MPDNSNTTEFETDCAALEAMEIGYDGSLLIIPEGDGFLKIIATCGHGPAMRIRLDPPHVRDLIKALQWYAEDARKHV